MSVYRLSGLVENFWHSYFAPTQSTIREYSWVKVTKEGLILSAFTPIVGNRGNPDLNFRTGVLSGQFSYVYLIRMIGTGRMPIPHEISALVSYFL